MKLKQQSPVWPYLAILACLFVLSVTAPRAWDRMVRKQTLRQVLPAHKPRPAAHPEPIQLPIAKQLVELEAAVSDELVEHRSIDEAPQLTSDSAPELVAQPVAEAVPPAPEFAAEVREPEVATAVPASEPAAEVLTPPRQQPPETSEAAVVVDSSSWTLPRTLVEQLMQLAQEEPSATWAQQATGLIHELCRQPYPATRPASEIIKDLRSLVDRNATAIAADPPLESQIIRVQYALARWLDVWEPAAALDLVAGHESQRAAAPRRLAACLADLETLSHKGAAGAAWREYLQLDALRRLIAAHDVSETERRALSRKLLDRLHSSRLSPAQRKFIGDGPLATLQSELRFWAAEPITSARLLAHMEQYESTGLASDARLVANDCRGLSWSAPREAEKISEQLETHYRNANVRIAISRSLANRMIPQPQKIESPVNDTVGNTPVRGRSTTFTKISVRFVPDPRRIRIGVEADGQVASDTVSTSGPATFHNAGKSTFLVRKLLVLGPQGLSVWPAVAEAENNYTYLVSLETNFDGVPLVGSLVRNIARSKHDDVRDESRGEVEHKVATRARDQFDREIRPQLMKAAEHVEKKQLATLHRLGLELVPLTLSTTEERVVGRLRVAGVEQLGAHTPRPRAPSDSWMSLQVHQSALNNVIERLQLEGRQFALPELFSTIGAKLDMPELADQKDLPDDVRLKFADKDAIRLRCEGNRVEVTFAFAELVQGRNRWRDFTVRTSYQPERDGLSPEFTRGDSTIHLEGKSLKGKPQVLLRTIFAKVLSRNRDIHLLSESLTSDPRLKDLEITQFNVEDGWIGLAYSPLRVTDNGIRFPKQAQARTDAKSLRR